MSLTEYGFIRPTYEELLEQQIGRAQVLFGEDIDTSELTPFGKYIRLNVTDLADCYEILEGIYYARFPNSATGTSLDRLCPFAGISRRPPTYARHKIIIKGTPGYLVEMGFKVSSGDVTFYTDDDYTIGEDGSIMAFVECTDAGIIGNVLLGSIDQATNPEADIESVQHLGVVEEGKPEETDPELRIRFNESITGIGSATVEAIRGAISRVPLVDGVTIIENDTAETDGELPPHSFCCYVLAPESQDLLIAEAIFDKKPLGIKSIGEVEVEVLDKGMQPHTICFSRTRKKSIFVKAKIAVNQFFELDGTDDIQKNISDYINTLGNGEEVYLSSLFGFIHSVNGVVTVQRLEMSDDGVDYSDRNINIGDNEVARCMKGNIQIEVTA